MEDINETLNRLIIKYEIDSYYPKFRKRLRAEKILKDFFQTATGGGGVACVVTFKSDIVQIKHLAGSHLRIDCFTCEKTNEFAANYHTAFNMKELEGVEWSQYEKVIIASREGASFVKHWLRLRGIKYIFLYDLFEQNGLVFDSEWDSLVSDPAMEWWTYHDGDSPQKKYIIAELMEQIQSYRAADEERKLLHLHKSYFLALHIRDFLLAKKCISLMGKNSEKQIASWREIEVFLADIKQNLQKVDRKDILLLWTDALSYEDIEQVPYLEERMTRGVSFSNMFTVCPYTNPTFKAILCGKLPISEDTYSIKEITEGNSPVYRLLRRNGYHICIIGDWPSVRIEERSSICHIEYEPTSMCLWDLWRNILQADTHGFYCVHSLLESHTPYLSPELLDEEMDNDYLRFGKSCKYLSEQYQYYLSSLSQKMVRFYMTDHGKFVYKTRFHTYLVVEGEGIVPHRAKELCSLVDFHYLLAQVLEENAVDVSRLKRDYVEVQDLDYYYPPMIARTIKGKQEIWNGFFGYHGVITAEYMYLHFTDGREWFVRHGTDAPEPNLFGSYICDEGKIAPFREIIQKRKAEMTAFENKLKYSKYMHIISQRGKELNRRKKELLDEWLQKYAPGSILIRTGGANALQIYDILSKEVQKRIGGFIDINPKCLCAGLRLPVYTSMDCIPSTTRGVLLATRQIISWLREEAAPYSDKFDILDPYQFLAEHGIICRNGAGAFEPTEEDYEVDFPFDEVIY